LTTTELFAAGFDAAPLRALLQRRAAALEALLDGGDRSCVLYVSEKDRARVSELRAALIHHQLHNIVERTFSGVVSLRRACHMLSDWKDDGLHHAMKKKRRATSAAHHQRPACRDYVTFDDGRASRRWPVSIAASHPLWRYAGVSEGSTGRSVKQMPAHFVAINSRAAVVVHPTPVLAVSRAEVVARDAFESRVCR
jgi:hypothetical protein